jgi:hypothetical protein
MCLASRSRVFGQYEPDASLPSQIDGARNAPSQPSPPPRSVATTIPYRCSDKSKPGTEEEAMPEAEPIPEKGPMPEFKVSESTGVAYEPMAKSWTGKTGMAETHVATDPAMHSPSVRYSSKCDHPNCDERDY